MAGPNGSVLENFNDFEMDDIDEKDNENADDVETIEAIMHELASNNKKRRYSNDNDANKPNVPKESSRSLNGVRSSVGSTGCHGNSTRNKQFAKGARIEPVIFFKVQEKPDKSRIEKYLIDTIKDVNIEDFKITANNNVLIYTNSNEDNEKLVNNKELFNGIDRLNLNAIDKRRYIMIKNVTYDFIKDKDEELVRVGIIEVIEIKNKISGNSYNFVKALIINEETKRELLNERFIRIGISKIYLEDFVKPPTQCRKCKAIGHIEKNCKSTRK
jgi:hypothetical protein